MMRATAIPETRIARRFRALAEEGRGALATFSTAGDPDFKTSLDILEGLAQAGADIIELGMPFSDPMADGPAVQAASLRALKGGQTMVKTLDMVRRFRQTDDETPIVLMGYYNPIYVYGVARFLRDATEAGVDGLIVVDLPPEEDAELCLPALEAGINFIYLAAPTTDDARLSRVVEQASGFVYYVSITGITGTRSASQSDIETAYRRLRRHTDLPIVVGFGIRTPEQAGAVAKIAEGAAVGSALVGVIAENLDNAGKAKPGLVRAALAFVGELAHGVRSGSRK